MHTTRCMGCMDYLMTPSGMPSGVVLRGTKHTGRSVILPERILHVDVRR